MESGPGVGVEGRARGLRGTAPDRVTQGVSAGCRRAFRSDEGVEVPLDDRVAGEQRRRGRRRRARARRGCAVLRPSLAPLRAMMAAPTTVPAMSATKIAGATARPRKRPITRRELDVAHAHAGADRRARRSGRSRPPPRRRSGARTRSPGSRQRARARRDATAPISIKRVRDDPVVEVDQRDRDEQDHEREPRSQTSLSAP